MVVTQRELANDCFYKAKFDVMLEMYVVRPVEFTVECVPPNQDDIFEKTVYGDCSQYLHWFSTARRTVVLSLLRKPSLKNNGNFCSSYQEEEQGICYVPCKRRVIHSSLDQHL